MAPTKEKNQFLCTSLKKFNGDPGNYQGRRHEPYTEIPNSPRPKMVRQVKSKVKSMLITFFDIKGIVRTEFVLAGQTVNSAYYCNILW
jgi:hypothetical protein